MFWGEFKRFWSKVAPENITLRSGYSGLFYTYKSPFLHAAHAQDIVLHIIDKEQVTQDNIEFLPIKQIKSLISSSSLRSNKDIILNLNDIEDNICFYISNEEKHGENWFLSLLNFIFRRRYWEYIQHNGCLLFPFIKNGFILYKGRKLKYFGGLKVHNNQLYFKSYEPEFFRQLIAHLVADRDSRFVLSEIGEMVWVYDHGGNPVDYYPHIYKCLFGLSQSLLSGVLMFPTWHHMDMISAVTRDIALHDWATSFAAWDRERAQERPNVLSKATISTLTPAGTL